ncbi:related to YPI1 - inhibitor of the type I protein phosphatase Glc7p [Ustilago trichophora]|uniref:Type 1 phosphatases regulator n=1 Tax=Ustilago trichophora TaxID=86804 RepID=A0A5C3E0Q9_9BASI|nr:related to YPI1 - inhibitor of the type I protein phosphatase Glc7p [Ustilago trichophora]
MNGRHTQQASGPSRTITLTANSIPPPAAEDVGILRLRPDRASAQTSASSGSSSRRVVWTEETVDNEGLGRKKSKICCIYHKPKAFDESSDESSSSSSSSSSESSDSDSSESESDPDSEPDGSQGPNLSKGVRQKMKQRKTHQHRHDHGHDHKDGQPCTRHQHNHTAKNSRSKTKPKSSAATQTVTLTEEAVNRKDGKDEYDKEESDDDAEGRDRFRPNAYERGTR